MNAARARVVCAVLGHEAEIVQRMRRIDRDGRTLVFPDPASDPIRRCRRCLLSETTIMFLQARRAAVMVMLSGACFLAVLLILLVTISLEAQ